MSSLLSLPTEMLQGIIDRANPDDLINFSVCCKKIKGAAERRLRKHRERIKTYSKLRYSGCFKHEDAKHPVKLLREICLDEHVALYPRGLSITCCEVPDDLDDFENDENLWETALLAKQQDRETVREVFDEFESVIDEKLSKALCYNDKNISIWRQRLKRGARSTILCLLLLLLPNLEQIHLTNFECEGEVLGNMLGLIAEGIHDPDAHSGPVALTKLSKVSVEGPEEEYGGCQILAPFAALPSLRTLTAKSLFGDSESLPNLEDLKWPYEQNISGLTVLNLQSSCLSAASFCGLLGGIKALKSFTYDHDGPIELDYAYPFPVDEIIDTLLEHAKASLECVAFTGFEPWYRRGDYDRCSFKDFKVLKHIRIHTGFYLKDKDNYQHWEEERFRDWYDDIERLVDILPASVRSIELDGPVDTLAMTTLLKELPERKAESVPHLKSINFIDYCTGDHKDDRRRWADLFLTAKCRNVGIKLIL